MMQDLARYWATDYDWRKVEATLNAIPQFITNIDGLDIQFIHVRSKHQTALPLIVTHGWPYSIISMLKIIERLTNPTARGASASDAFHLVIPSLPGYGFSGKPVTTGWGPDRIASAWAAGVSQTDPLQQGYERRALCGLGAAKNLFRRGSRGLKIAACIAEHGMFATPSAFAGLLYKGDIV